MAAAGPPDGPARTSTPPSSIQVGPSWQDEGWQLGRIRRRCRRAPFIHVVGYRTPIAAFAGEVDTLLGPATY